MVQDLNEISDGRIYGWNDMVKAACGGCNGCHSCCQGMGSSIVLEPLDAYRLTGGTGKAFTQLLEETIELHVSDGMILPNLRMSGSGECCAYLNEEGRCSIHAFRPGLCRLFPLGRIYEEDAVYYFLQKDACQKENRSKVKVSRWLDIPEQKKNEAYLLAWHGLRKRAEKCGKEETDGTKLKTVNLFLLNQFYIKPYDTDRDFYCQFQERLQETKQVLQP